jgi:hypothetical protein
MYEEGIQKYDICVNLYRSSYGITPVEPLLYKIIHLIKMSFEQSLEDT